MCCCCLRGCSQEFSVIAKNRQDNPEESSERMDNLCSLEIKKIEDFEIPDFQESFPFKIWLFDVIKISGRFFFPKKHREKKFQVVSSSLLSNKDEHYHCF